MTIDRRRYGRQIRLAEIGEAGQARLSATKASVRSPEGSLARAIEERYLRGAGLGIDDVDGALRPPTSSSQVTDALEPLGLHHPAAREVGEGALAALATIRAALGLPGDP